MVNLDGEQQKAAARAHLESLDKPALVRIILAQAELIEELRAENRALRVENQELRVRIEALEAKLRTNSKNSHKPPSSDPPGVDKGFRGGRHPEDGPKRRRGGQPGHKGSHRSLMSEDEVSSTVECTPPVCDQCGLSLEGYTDSNPERRQVTELPPVRATTTEFRVHTVTCPCCGGLTKGQVPEGTPAGSFGPRLQALIGYLSGACRASKRCIEEILGDCFDVPISLGSVASQERAVSEAIAAPVAEAAAYVRQHATRHADETGWRECGKRAWLWLAATPLVAVFLISHSRGGAIARELLGALGSWILVSDRWSGYNWIPMRYRQLCWAHLRRDFKKLVDAAGEAGRIGTALREQTKQLFKLWNRTRDGTLRRSSCRTLASPIRVEIRRLLVEGSVLPQKRLAGMCAEILKLEPAMWTFLRVEGVEPTNNHAERLVRHAVMWRKTSLGTQSVEGSRFVSRILTTVSTLRLQKRNVLDYLAAACTAATFSQPAPSLLPSVLTENFQVQVA
jgi:transposase